MGKNFRETLKKELRDPEFKKEYDSLEIEFRIINELIKLRTEEGLSQIELAKKAGISQADISRLENGKSNPSVKMLQRIACAVGKELHVEFR